MSRPIDDNSHPIDHDAFYIIPYKKYRNYDAMTANIVEEEGELTLCEACFKALLELLNDKAEECKWD